ncbi:MAG: tetratricopeptide repeat protein [Deltaproteobacteria bacterium]|nr:tetratricopeptide repeat protein [Deltaproteobacteria bacterium]
MSRHWVAMGVFLLGAVAGIGSLARWGIMRGGEQEAASTHGDAPSRGEAPSLGAQVAAVLGGRHDPAEFPKMEQALLRLAREHPDNTTILLNLGILQGAQGRIEDAEASFSKVRDLDPEDYDAIAELAAIAELKGQTETALELLEKIPPQKGRMVDRLRRDPNWVGLRDHPRMKALYEKHGVRHRAEGQLGGDRHGHDVPTGSGHNVSGGHNVGGGHNDNGGHKDNGHNGKGSGS